MLNPWLNSKYFRRDKIAYPERTDPRLVLLMDEIRADEYIIHINRCHDPKASPTSQHRNYYCHAADIHMTSLKGPDTLFDQFIYLSRHFKITAIGVYPYWNTPGFHIDMRKVSTRKYWWRDDQGTYKPLTLEAFVGSDEEES